MTTGLCTNRYLPPQHIVASAALLRLAAIFFTNICLDREREKESLYLGVWTALRQIAETLLARGALELHYNEAYMLRMALKQCPPGRDVDFLNSLTFNERG